MTLLIAGTGMAQEPLVFDDAGLEARYLILTKEFRCLVCQNQNLADSDAPLAHDLREEIYEMLQAGKTDDQIRAFLVDRYGDFVLYRPPVKPNTVALWLFPALLLGVGAIIVLFAVRRQKRQPVDEETEHEE
ncbi:MAG TPA: cytochrome c-type biogenesis protein [Xanthomonadales bacterium]|nr:cytochrome c-type biogenesis protein [Xanthomonadales bacterium]